MGSVGPGTLLTVVLAIVGPEKGTALAAFTASPISVVGTVPTRSISRVLLEESEVSRNAEVWTQLETVNLCDLRYGTPRAQVSCLDTACGPPMHVALLPFVRTGGRIGGGQGLQLAELGP